MAKKAVAKAVAKSLVFCIIIFATASLLASCLILRSRWTQFRGWQYGNPARRGGAAAAARYRRRYCTRYP
jgi:hypothetical protein